MMRFSRSLGLAQWAGIWQRYMTEAVHACAGQPLVRVSHEQLVRRPEDALRALHARLTELGVALEPLDAARLATSLELRPPAAAPEWLPAELAAAPEALALYEALVSTAVTPTPPARAAWPALPAPNKAQAYATLLTTDDATYLSAAVALGSSIRAFDGGRQMLALVTPDVPATWYSQLAAVGWRVRKVEPVAEFWWGSHSRCKKFEADQDERWGHMATKLRLWQQTQYEQLLYLDADALLLGPAEELFARFDAFAAEAGVSHTAFNAGVMLLRPSLATFEALLQRGKRSPPHIFGSVIDCTEQGLLNAHFDGSDASRVAGRFDVAHPWAAAAPAAAAAAAAPVAHWITLQCPKPWDHMPWRAAGSAAAAAATANCSAPLYRYWWRTFNRTESDALEAAPAPRSFVRQLGLDYNYPCSAGCRNEWVDDGMCDAMCNVEACGWDGKDCFQDAGECWHEEDGKDYRGKVAMTKGGRPCQMWSDQIPWHHTKTVTNFPSSGLGGHNFCRNPDGEDGPWCFTLDYPHVRWELCDVGARSATPCGAQAGPKTQEPPSPDPPPPPPGVTMANARYTHVSLVKPIGFPDLQGLVRSRQNTFDDAPFSLDPVCAARQSDDSFVEAPCSDDASTLRVPFGTRSYALRRYDDASCADTSFGDSYSCVDYARGAYFLAGRTLSFTIDLSGDGCGCNAAVYLVSMPQSPSATACGDRYCDANTVCGVPCAEIDLIEANRNAFVSTVHVADDGNGEAFGEAHYVREPAQRWRSARSCSYGPSPNCTIDTTLPFGAAFAFSPATQHFYYNVTLSQAGRVATAGPVEYRAAPSKGAVRGAAAANAQLRRSVDAGMTLVVSHWGGATEHAMGWLDEPCSAQEVAGWGCSDDFVEHPEWEWVCGTEPDAAPQCAAFTLSSLALDRLPETAARSLPPRPEHETAAVLSLPTAALAGLVLGAVLVASAAVAALLCCARLRSSRHRGGAGGAGGAGVVESTPSVGRPLASVAAELRAVVELAQHKQRGARLEEQSGLVTERQSEKSSTTQEPVRLVVTGIIKARGRRAPVGYENCCVEET